MSENKAVYKRVLLKLSGEALAKDCQKELEECRGKLTILKNELDSFEDEE